MEGMGNGKVHRTWVFHTEVKYMKVSVGLGYFWLCDLLGECCAGNHEWIIQIHYGLDKSPVFK